MIPAVEDRQDRLCEECVFFKGAVMMDGWSHPKTKCNLGRFMSRDGGSCGRKIRGVMQPCKSNFTRAEMKEWIDSGQYDQPTSGIGTNHTKSQSGNL